MPADGVPNRGICPPALTENGGSNMLVATGISIRKAEFQKGERNLFDIRSDDEKNQALDTIIRERRSIRAFVPDPPRRELVEAVIEAGLQAAFAALAVSGTDYRRFKVITRDTRTMAAANDIVKRSLAAFSNRFQKEMEQTPYYGKGGKPLPGPWPWRPKTA